MGISWSKIGHIMKGLAPPVVFSMTGPVATTITAIGSAIQGVERLLANKPSGTKRKQAMEWAMSLVVINEGAVGKDLVDNYLVRDAMKSMIDAEVAVLNAKAALAEVIDDVLAKHRARGSEPA